MSRAGPSTVFNFRGNGDGQWISMLLSLLPKMFTRPAPSGCKCLTYSITTMMQRNRSAHTARITLFTCINSHKWILQEVSEKKAMLRLKHLTNDKEGREGSTIHWPLYFTEEKISRMAIAWCFPANSRFSCVCSGCKSEEESRPPFDELFDGLSLLR